MPYLDEFCYGPSRKIGGAQVGGAMVGMGPEDLKRYRELYRLVKESNPKLKKSVITEKLREEYFPKAKQAAARKKLVEEYKAKGEKVPRKPRSKPSKPVSAIVKAQRTEGLKNYNRFLVQYQARYGLSRRDAQKMAKEMGAYNSKKLY